MMDLMHSGVAHDDAPPGRGSGRYAWGSGENPMQHQNTFISTVNEMKKKGVTDKEIAVALLGEKASSVDLKAELSIAKSQVRKWKISEAQIMLEKCNGNVSEAARRLGMKNESSLRSLLDPLKAERTDRYQNTAETLMKIVDEKGMVDIGAGVEYMIGSDITRNTFDTAVKICEKNGYLKSWIKIPQMTTNKKTTTIVLAKPGTTHSEVQQNKFNVKPIQEFTPDGGKSWWTPEYPSSLDSKRVYVRYAEEGGKLMDGVIELRPGVEDISLGGPSYSQVRIAVDDTNYMKGMAVYSDDIPDGYDIVYNTNKKKGTPLIDPNATYNPDNDTWSGKEVTKRLKINPATGEIDRDNPFGASIKTPKDMDGVIMAGGQRHYTDKNGKDQLSPVNRLRDEGDWNEWSRNLSAQFLSKQPMKLINQQIAISKASKQAEFDEIMELNNPVLKKKMLEDYAAGCDRRAVDLSLKGFKNQCYQVILPVPKMKETEIYAPNFKDGDTVALIRYPHGGQFEIPVLTVNNKDKHGEVRVGKHAGDAVGINPAVAEVLSGADFDGDFVAVIPLKSNKLKVATREPLPGLKGFEPKELYKLPDDAPKVTNRTKQIQMGVVTNLITDMTAGGATFDEIERAVKHSMVVIDAEKHHLDYKQSAKDNNIQELKVKWQKNLETGKVGGASTIFSLARHEERIPERKEVTDVNKMTPEEQKRFKNGEVIWHETGALKKVRIDDPNKMTPDELALYKSGRKVYRETTPKEEKVPAMMLTRDARTLVRDKDNPKEMAYADYCNDLKAMANQARKEARNIKPYRINTDARKIYEKEVASLNAKLKIAKSNAPKERIAQAISNVVTSAKFKDNPNMDFEHRKKEKNRAIMEARAQVGAKKEPIIITDREWEAIQAEAIASSTLSEIFINTDQEALVNRATPRKTDGSLSTGQIAKLKAMYASGMYTQKEIAESLGVSTSTISKALKVS